MKKVIKVISEVILWIFGIGDTCCLFAGAISLIGFIVALCIGGETATEICVFIHKTYFPWVIKFTTVFTGLGLLGMYLTKTQSLSIGKKKKADEEKKEEENA